MKALLPAILLLFVFSANGLAGDLVSEVWSDTVDSGNGHDYYWGVAIDSQGNVYAAGFVRGIISPEHHTDAYIKKYPADGSDPWTDTLDMGAVAGSKADSNDRFYDAAVDSEDNIIVVGIKSGTWTGYSVGSYHQTALTRKYSPDGTLLWERTYQDGAGSAWDGAYGVAVDGSDNIYVAGSSFTGWGSIEHQWAIWKYDKDGTLQSGFPVRYNYSSSHQYPDRGLDVALDKDGNFIAVGYRGVASGNLDWHVRKYDSNRTLVWEDTYSGAANVSDIPYGVAVDSKGDVFAVAYAQDGADYDWLIIKYRASDGERLWTKTFDSGAGNDYCYDVTVDPADNVVVGGCANVDSKVQWRIERRGGEDGSLIAEQAWESDNAASIYGLDYRDRRIALCGYENNGTDHDMHIRLVSVPPPEINLSGDDPLVLKVGTAFVEPGFTVTDDFGEDLTGEVVTTGTVDHTTLGAYEIHYNVSASNGDPAEEKVRTVNVVDTTAPEITLEGDDTVTLEVGTAFVDPGSSAMDNYDGDITGEVAVSGSVDHTIVGEYTLRYNVSDSSGNPAAEQTRTVNVVDTTAPAISLLGDNPMSLNMGTLYDEPGFTATDNYDGDLSASVAVTGSVDENTPGSYDLQYNVSDSSGNPAAEQVRTVNVIDTTPFTFTEFVEITESIFQLTWESRPGDNFVIWSSTDLLAAWVQVQTIGSQGETTTWLDPSAGGKMKFYKIERK